MVVINPSFLKGEISVSSEEIVGLLGRSGSGKTSIIKEVLGFGGICQMREGRMSIDLPPPRDLISGVLQDPNSQVLGGSCEDEIELLSMDHRVDAAMAERLMGQFFRKNFFQLSDGYKKRYALATVMASKPRYLFLDEPLANLDSRGVAQILSIIPKGSLVAEHRVKEIRNVIDRVYVISGKSVAEVDVDRLYDGPFLRANGLRGFSVRFERGSLGKLLLDVDVGFNLEVREGEVVGLYGNNGSGKTTAIKKLSKKVYPVFQNPDLQFFKRTVFEEVQDENALRAFGLADKADASPFTLSFGEKMRVLMAAALSSEKKVLAFDEPTTGMDGDAFLSFLSAVKSMKEQGRGIVIATHDEDLIALCDEVINLESRERLRN